MLFHEVLTILKQEYGPEIVNDAPRMTNKPSLHFMKMGLLFSLFLLNVTNSFCLVFFFVMHGFVVSTS